MRNPLTATVRLGYLSLKGFVRRKRKVLDHLHTARARSLHKAMLEARELFETADERYQHALAAALSAEASMDGLQVVRHEGRAYAQALTQYSNAAMTWLTYVDARPQARKATGKE